MVLDALLVVVVFVCLFVCLSVCLFVCLFVCFVIACHCKITAYVGDSYLIFFSGARWNV